MRPRGRGGTGSSRADGDWQEKQTLLELGGGGWLEALGITDGDGNIGIKET